MGIKNPINAEGTYFLTLTVVDWVDIFTRPVYKNIIVDSLKYCQKNKGLELFAWVLMTNHLHLIARTREGHHLSDFLRDFKKFTSKQISSAINDEPESRKDWMIHRLKFHVNFDETRNYQVWKEGNEAKEIHSNDFLDQKINYIHQNPVEAGIVYEPENYIYSSAIDYVGGKGFLEIVFP
ncbi:REP-associated tyrosine transposase [Ekhidna sp.]|uniref:REP-associated tyrosine transposase n=1 Tax=Ekhidna sp. TaxID=2608089 RepID=UPI003CCBDEFF